MFRNFFIILIVLALAGCQKVDINNTKTGVVGENEPVTRGEAARMVSLNSYSLDEINKMERKIDFEDTDISKWYDKYINAAFSAGIIAGVDNEHFAPDEYLSLRQAQFLLDKLKVNNNVKLQYANEDRDKPIPYNIWVAAFEKSMNSEKLKTQVLKIYADKSQCKGLGDNFVITDRGLTYYEGYEKLKSQNEINAILNNNTIAALKNVNSVSQYNDLEVVEEGKNFVRVKLPGGTLRFEGENKAEVGDLVTIEMGEKGIEIKK